MTAPYARHLRSNPTAAEQRLWRVLRQEQLEGRRFRRQFQIGAFIADFACPQLRLVVEVDGGQHSDNSYDAARDEWLSAEGWLVLRFWNNEVLENLDGVASRLLEVMARRTGEPYRPTPTQPSPIKGEG